MIYALKTFFMKFLCVVFCGMFSSEGIFPIGRDLSELQRSKGRGPGAATQVRGLRVALLGLLNS